MSYIRVGGVDIEYYDDDFRDPWSKDESDPVVLMVHGCGESASTFIPIVPGLLREHRVIRYSIRGCGNSSMPADRTYFAWSGEALSNEALNLVNALHIPQVHFIGWGSGGVWGQLFALNYPNRTKSLTLINAPSKMPDETIERYTLDTAKYKDWPTAMEAVGFPEWSRRTLDIRTDTSVGDPRAHEWMHRQKSSGPALIGAAVNEFVRKMDLRPRQKDIKCPTLLMSGDRSPITPVEYLRFQEQEIPNAKLVIFENLGTGCIWLKPDRVVEELRTFYRGVKENKNFKK